MRLRKSGLKKPLCLAMATVMAVGVFAGCGQTTKGQTGNSSSASHNPVTLTMWVTPSQQTDFNLAQEKRFTDKYPWITLNKIQVAEGKDYLTSFAAGNAPDLVQSVGMPDVSKFVFAGAVEPLDNYLNSWADAKQFDQSQLDNFKFYGHRYALPSLSYVMVLVYNKTLFSAAGISEAPTTWDGLVSTAQKLTDASKQQWGMNLLLSQTQDWWFEYFVWQAGGDLTTKGADGTLKLTFTDPAVTKAINFYRQLISAKAIESDITLDSTNLNKQFAAGHVGMTVGSSSAISTMVKNGMNPDEVGYAPLPVGPSGKKVTQMGGNCAIITAGLSKDKKDAAWDYLSFINSKDEIESNLKDQSSKGSAAPQLMPRKDIDTSLAQVRSDLQSVVSSVTSDARLEYYGKATVSSYVCTAIQKCALDASANINSVFQSAQDLAQREVVDKFNSDIKSSNKANAASSTASK